MNKYTTYALRGFGSFNLAMGRGLFGLELQKSLRRKANARQHRLWEMEIRTPLTNRLINGIALGSWGEEDGRVAKSPSLRMVASLWIPALSISSRSPTRRLRVMDVREQPCTCASIWIGNNQDSMPPCTVKNTCNSARKRQKGLTTSLKIAQSSSLPTSEQKHGGGG